MAGALCVVAHTAAEVSSRALFWSDWVTFVNLVCGPLETHMALQTILSVYHVLHVSVCLCVWMHDMHVKVGQCAGLNSLFPPGELEGSDSGLEANTFIL